MDARTIGEALSLVGFFVLFGLGLFALIGGAVSFVMGAPKEPRGRAIPRGRAVRVTDRAAKRAHGDALAMDAINRAGMARA